MALILKNGAIFLHIPKTGGNWVATVLRECNLVKGSIGDQKHIDIDRLFSLPCDSRWGLLKQFINWPGSLHGGNKPFMFCFVRHPLSWYESWFKYMTQPARNWRYWGDKTDIRQWHPNALLNGLGSPDFNQFVRNVLRERPGYVTELFGWYTKPQVDFIGKQENLREDLIKVLNMMELSFDEVLIREFPMVGLSPKPQEKIVWEKDVREEAYRSEYAGIIRYGYLPGNSGLCAAGETEGNKQ
ncbi:MAG: hypothetical protein WC291_12435 [Thermodesulfovibrionales bacterium]|jgi:hypothetical protein